MGVPLITSAPCGAATRLALQSGCGPTVPPGDGEAIARAAIHLLGHKHEMEGYAAAGLTAASTFTREKQATATMHTLQVAVREFRMRQPS